MKLKKIASLALAGIMAVSMLAGCKDGGNGNSGSSSSENTNTTSGYSAMLGQKAADTLSKADNADLFTFADNADDQKALEKVIREEVSQANIVSYIQSTSVTRCAVGGAVSQSIYNAFEDEAGLNTQRPFGGTFWSSDDINTDTLGDVWVANGNISMDNVMSTIFEAYKDGFKAEDGKGAWNGANIAYDYDVAVSVVNVPVSNYKDYTGSVNFIAVTVTRTAEFV